MQKSVTRQSQSFTWSAVDSSNNQIYVHVWKVFTQFNLLVILLESSHYWFQFLVCTSSLKYSWSWASSCSKIAMTLPFAFSFSRDVKTWACSSLFRCFAIFSGSSRTSTQWSSLRITLPDRYRNAGAEHSYASQKQEMVKVTFMSPCTMN